MSKEEKDKDRKDDDHKHKNDEIVPINMSKFGSKLGILFVINMAAFTLALIISPPKDFFNFSSNFLEEEEKYSIVDEAHLN